VPITFIQEDYQLKSTNYNDTKVIEVNIAGWVFGKILVDNGSSADILFLKTFEKMNLTQHMLHPLEYPLQGFGGKPIRPVGKVSLPVSFGDLDNARTETLTFDVVDIYHPYLAIFGRGFTNKFDVVIRQQFLCMKIPAPKGVITVFGDQQEARNIEKGHTPGQTNVYQLNSPDEKREPYIEAKRDKEKIEIHYVKTSNRSRNICNGPLTPITSTHICNGCCLAPVTYKRASTIPGLASTTPVTNLDIS
jgi:hypothetical protein